jgi:hypothetical protein
MGVMAGLPDIGIIYQGRIVWLELKAPKGRVSATQAWCHRHLEHAGSPVYLCWGVDDVEAVLWEHMPLRAQVPV